MRLSHQVIAHGLRDAGHDALHVMDIGLLHAPDDDILARSSRDGRILVSADTDFGEILADTGQPAPSLIPLRLRRYGPHLQLQRLLACLSSVEADMTEGAIAVVEAARVRVRRLPIRRGK